MLDRHGARLPHAWITGDDEFGKPAEFRRELRDRHERYLLAVPCDTTIRDLEVPALPPAPTGPRPQRPRRPSQRVDAWTNERSEEAWTRIDVRDGEKGPIVVEAIRRHVETGQFRPTQATEEVLVVIRYQDRDERIVKTDYSLSNADPTTSLESFCRAAKAEHRIEQCFQRAKSEAGLADYEVRHWLGWQHHQTLSLIATWFLTVETRQVENKVPALTLPPVRQAVAAILHQHLEYDSPPHVLARIKHRMLRNQHARFYHWKSRNALPPKNLERRRF